MTNPPRHPRACSRLCHCLGAAELALRYSHPPRSSDSPVVVTGVHAKRRLSRTGRVRGLAATTRSGTSAVGSSSSTLGSSPETRILCATAPFGTPILTILRYCRGGTRACEYKATCTPPETPHKPCKTRDAIAARLECLGPCQAEAAHSDPGPVWRNPHRLPSSLPSQLPLSARCEASGWDGADGQHSSRVSKQHQPGTLVWYPP